MILSKWYETREEIGLIKVEMSPGENGSKRESQRIRWKVRSDEERETPAKMLGLSLYRPFCKHCPFHFQQSLSNVRDADLLCTEPVVFFFSLWAAFSWAILYLMFSIVPLVFTTNHNFNLEQNGAVFAGKIKRKKASLILTFT